LADQEYPHPTVGAIIIAPDHTMFLMRSHKWQDQYVMPGGHIELGETMEEALRREIREETGLEIHDIEFCGYQEFIYDPAYWKPRHFIFFDFACRSDSKDATLSDEGQSYVWVTPETALELVTEPYTLRAIRRYLGLEPRIA